MGQARDPRLPANGRIRAPSPQVVERQNQALRMALTGMSNDQIALALQYRSVAGAWEAVRAAVVRHTGATSHRGGPSGHEAEGVELPHAVACSSATGDAGIAARRDTSGNRRRNPRQPLPLSTALRRPLVGLHSEDKVEPNRPPHTQHREAPRGSSGRLDRSGCRSIRATLARVRHHDAQWHKFHESFGNHGFSRETRSKKYWMIDA